MRKQYTASFKAQVVQELLKEDKTIAQIAAKYEIHPTQLNQWKNIALKGLATIMILKFMLHGKRLYKN